MANQKPLHYGNRAAIYSGLHSDHRVKAHAWETIREAVSNTDIPKGWNVEYFQSSVVMQSPKKTRIVKITLAGEVFVDQKLKNGGVRSHKYIMDTIGQAAAKLIEVFQVSAAPAYVGTTVVQ